MIQRADSAYASVVTKPGPDAPDVVQIQLELGLLYFYTSQYEKAKPLLERGLQFSESRYVKKELEHSALLLVMADLYRRMENYDKSKIFYEKCLGFKQKILRANPEFVAMALSGLGRVYDSICEYDSSALLYKDAMQILEKSKVSEDEGGGGVLKYMADSLMEQGDVDGAILKYERALRILEDSKGRDHPVVAEVLLGLGHMYAERMDYPKARGFFERARKIFIKKLNPGNPLVAMCQNEMGVLYGLEGDHAKAIDAFEQGVQAREKELGSDHPDVARSLNNLALVYQRQGDYQKAKDLLVRGQTIIEHSIGTGHEDYIVTQYNLLQVHQSLGNRDTSVKFLTEMLAGARSSFEVLANAPLSRHKLTMLNKWIFFYSDALNNAMGLGLTQRELTEIYKNFFYFKGLSDEIMSRLPETATPFRAARNSPDFASLRQALSADALLVDYHQFFRADRDTFWIVAFVVDSAAVRLIDIGSQGSIGSVVQEYLETVLDSQSSSENVMQQGRAISAKILEPVLENIHGPRTILFSPVHNLQRISFGALPLNNGKYLMEQCEVRYISSFRDLLPCERPRMKNALYVSDVDYNRGKEEKTKGKIVFSSRHPSCVDLVNPIRRPAGDIGSFPQETLQALSQSGWTATALSRDLATETKLKLAVPRMDLVHITTAACFFNCRSSAVEYGRQSSPRNDGWFFSSVSSRFGLYDRQLSLRSAGIACAGVNNPLKPEMDDGYLASEEITAISLDQTQLVLLSCFNISGSSEDNLGTQIQTLLRSFMIAGAKAVAINLWDAPFEQRGQFLRAFYARWLETNDAGLAVQEASLGLLRERRAQKLSESPIYWAAFVSIGRT